MTLPAPVWLLHGVRISLAAPPGLRDLVAPLFALCEPVADDEPATISIRVDAAPTPHAPPAGPRDFFVGPFDGHAVGDGWSLCDGSSRLTVSDDGTSVEVSAHRSAMAWPDAFRVRAVMAAVTLALRYHGLFHVHAGAVVRPSGSLVVLAGGSGQGKSTATLALLRGARWLSDDALFVRDRGGVEVCGMPRKFHVAEATRAAYPWLEQAIEPGARTVQDKFVVDPRRLPEATHQPTARPPGVLLVPQIVDAPQSEFEPLVGADALGDLMIASAWVVVDGLDARAAHQDLLARWVDGSRCYRAWLGRDVLDAPAEFAARVDALS